MNATAFYHALARQEQHIDGHSEPSP
jgi:hypothetical protein